MNDPVTVTSEACGATKVAIHDVRMPDGVRESETPPVNTSYECGPFWNAPFKMDYIRGSWEFVLTHMPVGN